MTAVPITREMLARHFGGDQRMISAMEANLQSVADSESSLASNQQAKLADRLQPCDISCAVKVR